MKQPLKLMLSFLVLLILTACATETPEQSVMKGLDAVKNLDIKETEKYFDTDSFNHKFSFATEHKKLLFDHFDYENLDVLDTQDIEMDEDAATVKVNITNADMHGVMTEYLSQGIDLSIKNPEMSDEEIDQKTQEILISLLQDADIDLITNQVDIKLYKVEDKWIINLSDELLNAMYGGYYRIKDWVMG